jgi:hypothetical protein
LSGPDVAGLVGVVLIIIAYAGAALGRIDADRPGSLLCNLVGASLILFSLLTDDFNLSATVMEGTWAAVSLFGLGRWALRRR